MDRSITQKPNPADRLDEACFHLADYKCAHEKNRTTYQLCLLIEALREEAERSHTLMEALNDLAAKVEARLAHVVDSA